jgi:hypothetical protein
MQSEMASYVVYAIVFTSRPDDVEDLSMAPRRKGQVALDQTVYIHVLNNEAQPFGMIAP